MNATPQQLVDDARFSHVLDCWRRWRGPHLLPARGNISPEDMKILLPHVFMVEPVEDGRRFRYIMAGNAIRMYLGFELSGRFIDELFSGATRLKMETTYRSVLGGSGHYLRQHWLRRQVPVIEFRRLVLPLAEDGRRIDGIFGYAMHTPLPGHEGSQIDQLRDPVELVTLEEMAIRLD